MYSIIVFKRTDKLGEETFDGRGRQSRKEREKSLSGWIFFFWSLGASAERSKAFTLMMTG